MHVMNLQLHLVQTKSVRILTQYSETYHKTLSEWAADHITMLYCEHAALIINVSQNWSFEKCKTLTSKMGSWLAEAILSMWDQTLVAVLTSTILTKRPIAVANWLKLYVPEQHKLLIPSRPETSSPQVDKVVDLRGEPVKHIEGNELLDTCWTWVSL